MIGLSEIQAAAERLRGHIRRTPLLSPSPSRQPALPEAGGSLLLKLENLQVTGSFKVRGAINKVLTLSPEEVQRGLVTASGGNHGLGVAYAGHLAGTKASIFLPLSAPPAKAEKLREWGAGVYFTGAGWDEANAAALTAAERHGWIYVHPFADPATIAGQGTVGLEILEDAPDTEVLVMAVGGGGLIAGVAAAAKALKPGLRVVGVEPVGAPTLYESLRAGKVIELPRVATAAKTLAPRKSDAMNLELIARHVDEIVLVTDEEMQSAARWLWTETNLGVELAASAALAALQTGKVKLAPHAKVCAIVCGAGLDGIETASS
ncbi:MAG TPA: threonine/serine dehydratase [Thermoanaerobaculia bacterium]|nr:threonine/serine dehydratase [Thermoanaerobaculia bacterium]